VTTPPPVEQFVDVSAEPAVRGFLHGPADSNGNSLLLTHGAGANCQSNLLVMLSTAFAEAGFTVLRCDLPFRQARRFGPPSPGSAALDRQGIRRAIEVLKQGAPGRVFVGGHSYGGRQASMLIAEQPELAEGLLLLSYPLHPPRKPQQLRTGHFPKLERPALFVHGVRDPFGLPEEMQTALRLIPARHNLLAIEGVGHELLAKHRPADLPAQVIQAFQQFFRS
jgi:predicted alpha/beta-hydrolase family hydrolase